MKRQTSKSLQLSSLVSACYISHYVVWECLFLLASFFYVTLESFLRGRRVFASMSEVSPERSRLRQLRHDSLLSGTTQNTEVSVTTTPTPDGSASATTDTDSEALTGQSSTVISSKWIVQFFESCYSNLHKFSFARFIRDSVAFHSRSFVRSFTFTWKLCYTIRQLVLDSWFLTNIASRCFV